MAKKATKKVRLADVLWEAANVHLRASQSDYGKSHYTCDGVFAAAGGSKPRDLALRFLRHLGLPRGALERFDLFDQFDDLEQRQGVRYMWLLLAMHVAEDEGIEIEVEH